MKPSISDVPDTAKPKGRCGVRPAGWAGRAASACRGQAAVISGEAAEAASSTPALWVCDSDQLHDRARRSVFQPRKTQQQNAVAQEAPNVGCGDGPDDGDGGTRPRPPQGWQSMGCRHSGHGVGAAPVGCPWLSHLWPISVIPETSSVAVMPLLAGQATEVPQSQVAAF